MEAITRRSREEATAWLRQARKRQEAWQEDAKRREAELQVELQRAKDDPFYKRGTEGIVCENAPIAKPVFKRGSFVASIRKHRIFQERWQASISQKLLLSKTRALKTSLPSSSPTIIPT